MTAGANKFLWIYHGRMKEYLSELSDSGEQLHQNPDEIGELFLDSEPEVQLTAAAGLPLRGSQMDATMRGSDGSGNVGSVPEFLAVGQLLTASSWGSRKGGVRSRNLKGWKLTLTPFNIIHQITTKVFRTSIRWFDFCTINSACIKSFYCVN